MTDYELINRCDLLEKSYLCGINNNFNAKVKKVLLL